MARAAGGTPPGRPARLLHVQRPGGELRLRAAARGGGRAAGCLRRLPVRAADGARLHAGAVAGVAARAAVRGRTRRALRSRHKCYDPTARHRPLQQPHAGSRTGVAPRGARAAG